MEYRYACDSCGTLHVFNPTQCRGCGGTILKPVPVENLRSITSDESIPDTMDPNDIGRLGSTIEPEYESSPDVAIDGSVKQEQQSDEVSATTSSRNYKFALVGVILFLLTGLTIYVLL